MRTFLDSAIRRGDLGGHGMGELRLALGFVQLPLPFIGARQKADIVRITESSEMDPWRWETRTIDPFHRRIAEEAGVPRNLFGQSKMASAVIFAPPAIPYGKALRKEFFDYLAEEKIMARSKTLLWPIVRWVNSILALRSQKRFAVVYYAERVISKLIDGTSFSSHYGRSLTAHCSVIASIEQRKHTLDIFPKTFQKSNKAA